MARRYRFCPDGDWDSDSVVHRPGSAELATGFVSVRTCPWSETERDQQNRCVERLIGMGHLNCGRGCHRNLTSGWSKRIPLLAILVICAASSAVALPDGTWLLAH